MVGLARHANVTAIATSTSNQQSRQPPIGQNIPPRLPLGNQHLIVEQEQNPVPMATNAALATAHPRIKAMFALKVKRDKDGFMIKVTTIFFIFFSMQRCHVWQPGVNVGQSIGNVVVVAPATLWVA